MFERKYAPEVELEIVLRRLELLDKTLLDDETLDEVKVERLDEEVVLLIRADEELVELSFWYMFNLFEPPQYSPTLFLQIKLQPLTLGTELVWLTDPVLITLPQ